MMQFRMNSLTIFHEDYFYFKIYINPKNSFETGKFNYN